MITSVEQNSTSRDATRAADIMSTELLTVKPSMTVEDALKLMVNSRITGMPVVDDKGKLVGVVSEYDIIAQVGKAKSLKADIFKKPIQFSKESFTISEDMPLQDVIQHFLTTRYRRVPVVNRSGRLVGIITRRDLMRIFFYRSKLG